jgi:hypothetical protein
MDQGLAAVLRRVCDKISDLGDASQLREYQQMPEQPQVHRWRLYQ